MFDYSPTALATSSTRLPNSFGGHPRIVYKSCCLMSDVAWCVRSVSTKMSDVQVCLMLGGGSGTDAWRNFLGRGGGGWEKLRPNL